MVGIKDKLKLEIVEHNNEVRYEMKLNEKKTKKNMNLFRFFQY